MIKSFSLIMGGKKSVAKKVQSRARMTGQRNRQQKEKTAQTLTVLGNKGKYNS